MTVHTFPLDGPINLLVRIGHGAVTVSAQDDLTEASVQIDADPDAAELLAETTIDLRGPTLVISAPRQGGVFDLARGGRRRAQQGLEIHVVVPTGTAVKVSTFTAPIRIAGRVGGADLAFATGSADVEDVAGDLRLRYGSGTVSATRVGGSVQLRSGSGDAVFGVVEGDLISGSGTGDLRADVVHGSVRSRCGSGQARLGEVHGDVDLVSGAGAIEIGLPTGLTARLDVHTGSGRLHSDLPIEDEPADRRGAITVRARTGSGDVRLFRAA